MNNLFITPDSQSKIRGATVDAGKQLYIGQLTQSKPQLESYSAKNDVQWNTPKAIGLNLRTFCNPRCNCQSESARNSRSQRLEVKGYQHVIKEVSIVNILKQLRVLQAAARQHRSKKEW